MRKLIKSPTQTKFKKQIKGNVSLIKWKKTATNVTFGVYGIQILKSMRITLKQLEIARRLLSKFLNKSETFWFRVTPDLPVSKKPNELRMGKGKGEIAFWAARVTAGQTLFEFSFTSLKRAQLLHSKLKKRLPVPCHLLYNKKRLID